MNGMIYKVQEVLFSPDYFFRGVKREKGVVPAFVYFTILSLFATILSYFSTTYVVLPWVSEYAGNWLSFITPPTPLTVLGGFMAFLAVSFLFAGIIHLWCLLFGGKGTYTQSYRLYVYSHTPKFVFGWIPVIGFLAEIYSLVLLIIGTQRLHGISRNRAIWMYLIPYVAIMLFIGLVLALMVFGLRQLYI